MPNAKPATRIKSLAYAICVTYKQEGDVLWRVLHGGYSGHGYEAKQVQFDKIISEDRVNGLVKGLLDPLYVQVQSDILKFLPKEMVK